MHLTLAGGSLWRKGTCGTRHPLFFVFRGHLFLKCEYDVKRFRKCADPCQHFLTPDDTHDLCAMCLGKEHACSVLEGTVHCECFLWRGCSRLSLFSRELGQSSAPCGSGPAVAEAARRLRLWGLQIELADEFERGVNLSRSSEADKGDLLEEGMLSLTSSDPAGSALLDPNWV